jgi:hypothetical protein
MELQAFLRRVLVPYFLKATYEKDPTFC